MSYTLEATRQDRHDFLSAGPKTDLWSVPMNVHAAFKAGFLEGYKTIMGNNAATQPFPLLQQFPLAKRPIKLGFYVEWRPEINGKASEINGAQWGW